MTEIGERIGAIRDGNKDVVHFFGCGTYVGDEIPPGGLATQLT